MPWIFNKFTCDDKEEANALSFYFIEDAHIDLGLIGALSRDDSLGPNYLFRYIFDYLIWLTEGEPIAASGYDDYLYGTNHDKFAFLKYGRKDLPAYFDVDLIINFIKDFFCKERGKLLEGVTERTDRQDVYGTCDFCRKDMKNSEMERLSDGRMRCPECSEGAVDTDKAFRELCQQAEQAFKTHLGIDFSGINYEAHLVSAVELHKMRGKTFRITNSYDVRKLIGVAYDRKKGVFYAENGYQADKMFGTIVHEMTHIWQYNNENFQRAAATNEDLIEGLAVWTDLFLSEKHGVSAAEIEKLREAWLDRDDEYGHGLRFIMDHCPDDPYGYIL